MSSESPPDLPKTHHRPANHAMDRQPKLTASAQTEPGVLEYSWAQKGEEILIWERYA